MNITAHPSPNHDERSTEVDMLILHYTGMKSGKEAIDRLCSPESKVSCHYVVEEDGTIYQLVPEIRRAWHAGVSFWRGKRNLNSNSIGIEIVNPGHEFGYRPFTEAQYQSLLTLCKDIADRHFIPKHNIIGHSDIAPDRKEDPGELFDWKRLAENGIGMWPDDAVKSKKKVDLTKLGFEFHNKASITAFQRHWRQSKIDGIWDEECSKIASKLAALLS